MKYAIDTGAFLSLAQSSYFDEILKENKLCTTKEVLEEIEDIAQYEDQLGKAAQKILKKKQHIEVKRVKKYLHLKIEAAELSIFSLAKEQKYSIITDDIHAARIAKEKENLKSSPSFSLLLIMYKGKRISKEELQKDLENILYNRNWSSGVLHEYAKELIRNL